MEVLDFRQTKALIKFLPWYIVQFHQHVVSQFTVNVSRVSVYVKKGLFGAFKNLETLNSCINI